MIIRSMRLMASLYLFSPRYVCHLCLYKASYFFFCVNTTMTAKLRMSMSMRHGKGRTNDGGWT